MTRFELTEAGTLNHVAIYSVSGGAGPVKGLVYADNGGEPGAQVAVGAPVNVVANDFAISACSGEALTPGLYWIGAIHLDFQSSQQAAASGGTGWAQWGDSNYASPPDPWSGGGGASYLIAIYADYDPGGGPPEGAIEGTAPVAFTASATLTGRGVAQIVGAASVAFSASIDTLPPAGQRWAVTNSYGTLADGDTRLVNEAGSDLQSAAFGAATIDVPTYFEMRLIHGGAFACGVGIFGGSWTVPHDEVHIGVAYQQPSCQVQQTNLENYQVYGNNSLPEAVNINLGSYLGAPPSDAVVQFAIIPATREVWVKLASQGGYLGGGDPATGTTPTMVIAASEYPLQVYGCTADPGNSVQFIAPEAYVGDVPAGFVAGVGGELPSGELEGTAALALGATATASARGALTGQAGVAFAAAATGATQGALVGLAATAFTAGATLRAAAALAGTAALSLGASAAAAARGALAGQADVTFGASAAPSQPGITGGATLALLAAATLSAGAAAAGTSPLAFAAAGTAAARAAAAGTAPLALATAATASARAAAAGATTLSLAGSATPSSGAALSGAATVAFGASAAATGRIAAAGAAALTFAASAEPTQHVNAGHAQLTLGASGTLAARGALAGTAGLALTGTARTSSAGALAGATTLSFDTSAHGLLRAGMVAEASLVCAAVGALLARAAARGATAVVFTPTGAVSGAAGLAGSTGLMFHAAVYPGGLPACPPTVIAYAEEPPIRIVYAAPPPVVIVYTPSSPSTVPVPAPASDATVVVLGC